MNFAWPFLLLMALAAVLVLALQSRRSRGRGSEPLPSVLHAFAAGGRIALGRALPGRPWRFLLGILLLALAIGRPQWGTRPDDAQLRHRVVIALDLSNSMVATDALPSRIALAQAIAERFVAQSPTADIGLIGFAGRAWLLAAPSADRALLRTFLPAVHPDQMLVPGSNLAAMLEVAIDSFGTGGGPCTLVVLSDGEAEATPWRQLLPRLAARGIRIVSVGLGTPAGAPLRVKGRNLVDAGGAQVRSRLDPGPLRELADATVGAYLGAAEAGELAGRVEALGRQTNAAAEGLGTAKVDRFGWLALPALLLLLWSALIEWPALPRLRRRHAALPVALALFVTGAPSVAIKPLGEPDPLTDVKRVVSMMVASEPTATDYLALAQATATYGEVHRQHLHPLQIGVLQDGLAAVDAGAELEPKRRDWGPLRSRLRRLLLPPRSADDPEEGDGVPEGEAEAAADADEAGYDPNATLPDTRRVGGTQRSAEQDAEWRVPSLVRPAFLLEKLRAADRPALMFELLQRQDPAPPRKSGQTW